jgi:hypothetical protein
MDCSKKLVCAVHDPQPLADCDCKATPGISPMVYKVKLTKEPRNEEFRLYLSVPHDE